MRMTDPTSVHHSSTVGGEVERQWRGITVLAALRQKPISDFLYLEGDPGSMDKRPIAGSVHMSAPVRVLIVRKIVVQKGWRAGQNHQTCDGEPISEPHLQHKFDTDGYILCKISGHLYHLDKIL
ncbi:hypothetical protein XELAEV_18021400mg [Xenopus laevis]|uniref:Uncharacterized protein n=1 Tax=Xenopus laevis TaxID=8355 RepID=A0A974DBP0_XENLA|nr:hypothetical protein XELAEV_18021400mg [Xenopus laevis]